MNRSTSNRYITTNVKCSCKLCYSICNVTRHVAVCHCGVLQCYVTISAVSVCMLKQKVLVSESEFCCLCWLNADVMLKTQHCSSLKIFPFLHIDICVLNGSYRSLSHKQVHKHNWRPIQMLWTDSKISIKLYLILSFLLDPSNFRHFQQCTFCLSWWGPTGSGCVCVSLERDGGVEGKRRGKQRMLNKIINSCHRRVRERGSVCVWKREREKSGPRASSQRRGGTRLTTEVSSGEVLWKLCENFWNL